MVKKKRIGRPPGKTHPEVFVVRLPKGTLKAWRKSAKSLGVSIGEMVRQSVTGQIAKTKTKTKKGDR